MMRIPIQQHLRRRQRQSWRQMQRMMIQPGGGGGSTSQANSAETGAAAISQQTAASFSSKSKNSASDEGAWGGSGSSGSTTVAFDSRLKRLQRDNAARAVKVWRERSGAAAGTDYYDYFREEIAVRLVDRLDDIRTAEGFRLALDVGAGVGSVYRAICADEALDGTGGGIGGVQKLVQLDMSNGMLYRDEEIPVPGQQLCDTYRYLLEQEEEEEKQEETEEKMHPLLEIAKRKGFKLKNSKTNADNEPEIKLPFPDGTFDVVISSCSLHWVNDLPSLFSEIHRVLRPDGCFLLAMVGATTLPELRTSLMLAELERLGGVSASRVGPFVELPDVGGLLQRAGFALPTIDIDTLHVSFPNAAVLMEHLQRMGEGNASMLSSRRKSKTTTTTTTAGAGSAAVDSSGGVNGESQLDVFLATSCIYQHMYPLESQQYEGEEEDSTTAVVADSEIEASIQVIYAIGWTPHESQPQPKRRGSATHKVGEIVEPPPSPPPPPPPPTVEHTKSVK